MSAPPDEAVPPSVLAAKRSTTPRRTAARDTGRAYPLSETDDDLDAVSAQLSATRALVAASTPQEVPAIVATLVRDLGGGLVPARLAEEGSAMPLDVSFGLTEPMLPWSDTPSVGALRLARVLPDVVADARLVFDRLQADARRTEEAERDSLTGLLTRRSWMRRLSAAEAGDAVCLIDLDHFKQVNDSSGHAAGDEVLRAVGSLLLSGLRPGDACGRYGGDELACLATSMPAEALVERMDHLRASWQQQRPEFACGVGLSIGVAQVGAGAPRAALEAADVALYRAKASGRDATAVATDTDDPRPPA